MLARIINGYDFLVIALLISRLICRKFGQFRRKRKKKKADEDNDFFFFMLPISHVLFMIFFFVSVSLRKRGSSLIPSSKLSLFEEEQKMKS